MVVVTATAAAAIVNNVRDWVVIRRELL